MSSSNEAEPQKEQRHRSQIMCQQPTSCAWVPELRMLATSLFHGKPGMFPGPAQKSQPSIKPVRAGDEAEPQEPHWHWNVLGMYSAHHHRPCACRR